jgi:hypothetical protein
MQTWLVHMRAPILLWRELGPAGFVTLQLVVGGTALAALVHPVFIAAFAIKTTIVGLPIAEREPGVILSMLYGGTFLTGYLTSAILGLVGLARRRLLSSAWVLLLAPLHWILLSIAAWQAVWKLVRDPYRWDKTEHGLARTSRMDAALRAGARPIPALGPISPGIRISSEAAKPA